MGKIKFSINKETLIKSSNENAIVSKVPRSKGQYYTVMSRQDLINMDEKTAIFEMDADRELIIWNGEPGIDQAEYALHHPEHTSDSMIKVSAKELYEDYYEYDKNYGSAERAKRREARRQQLAKQKNQQAANKMNNKTASQKQASNQKQNTYHKNTVELEPPSADAGLEKWEEYRASIRHYSKEQFREIRKGIRQHLDVEKYTDINLTGKQMKQLRLALKSKIDVSTWNSPYVPVEKMKELRLGAKHGVRFDEQKIDHRLYNAMQIRELRLGFQKELPVKNYLNPGFSAEQMHEIRLGLQVGLDTSLYQSTKFTVEQMRTIRHQMVLDNIKEILSRMWEDIKEWGHDILDKLVDRMQASYTHREPHTLEEMKASRMEEAVAEIKAALINSEMLPEEAYDNQEITLKIKQQIEDLVEYMEQDRDADIEQVAEDVAKETCEEIGAKVYDVDAPDKVVSIQGKSIEDAVEEVWTQEYEEQLFAQQNSVDTEIMEEEIFTMVH